MREWMAGGRLPLGTLCPLHRPRGGHREIVRLDIPNRSHGWITSSARTSTDWGIVSPRALAALRLTTKWSLSICSIGRSPGVGAEKDALDVLGREPAQSEAVLTIARQRSLGDVVLVRTRSERSSWPAW